MIPREPVPTQNQLVAKAETESSSEGLASPRNCRAAPLFWSAATRRRFLLPAPNLQFPLASLLIGFYGPRETDYGISSSPTPEPRRSP